MQGECRVLHYDRGDKGSPRPYKNTEAIRAAINGTQIVIESVERARDFGPEKGAETRLLTEPFPYAAVIINGSGTYAQEVLDAAMLALDVNSLPKNRIVYLHQLDQPNDLAAAGVRCLCATGGNGHLSAADAARVAELLAELMQ